MPHKEKQNIKPSKTRDLEAKQLQPILTQGTTNFFTHLRSDFSGTVMSSSSTRTNLSYFIMNSGSSERLIEYKGRVWWAMSAFSWQILNF